MHPGAGFKLYSASDCEKTGVPVVAYLTRWLIYEENACVVLRGTAERNLYWLVRAISLARWRLVLLDGSRKRRGGGGGNHGCIHVRRAGLRLGERRLVQRDASGRLCRSTRFDGRRRLVATCVLLGSNYRRWSFVIRQLHIRQRLARSNCVGRGGCGRRQ